MVMMMEQQQCLRFSVVDAYDNVQTAVQHVTQGDTPWKLNHTMRQGCIPLEQALLVWTSGVGRDASYWLQQW